MVPESVWRSVSCLYISEVGQILSAENATLDTVATAIEDNLCAYAAFFGATSAAELSNQSSLLWVISRIPTFATFRAIGVAGLYEVATLPAYRHQRIASMITYHALNDVRQKGAAVATLVSSPMAEQLYRTLGFAEYCRLAIYN